MPTGTILPKSLGTGTKPTELDVPLLALIQTCAQNGVSCLRYGDLVINFMDHSQEKDVKSRAASFKSTTDRAGQPRPAIIAPEQRQLIEDYEQNQLMLDDPEGFENQIIDSHLRGHGVI